jgi:type IV pilus assembly protein PilA
MLQKLRKTNEKGFTLIELMIVIAIIGILAAIAIPNFISYRNKGYCSAAENDAKSIVAAVADYFSNPINQTISDGRLVAGTHYNLSYNNTATITQDATSDVVTIAVVDASTRCPSGTTYTTYVGGANRSAWSGKE